MTRRSASRPWRDSPLKGLVNVLAPKGVIRKAEVFGVIGQLRDQSAKAR